MQASQLGQVFSGGLLGDLAFSLVKTKKDHFYYFPRKKMCSKTAKKNGKLSASIKILEFLGRGSFG
jgi:hypothetical protein